jgi:hypothetical protein
MYVVKVFGVSGRGRPAAPSIHDQKGATMIEKGDRLEEILHRESPGLGGKGMPSRAPLRPIRYRYAPEGRDR